MFVDLAMMSAGDEPLNTAKVRCLHSAVIGYAPLIFDLTPDDCSYQELLKMCNIVWKELEANPKLPKQLVSILELTFFENKNEHVFLLT